MALFARKPSGRQKFSDCRIQEAVFALLHSLPAVQGINRSTWRLTDLQTVLPGVTHRATWQGAGGVVRHKRSKRRAGRDIDVLAVLDQPDRAE
jgi:hypothetical protein